MFDTVVCASYMDADEQYRSRVFTPSGSFEVGSTSLGLLAHAVEEQVKGLHPEAHVRYVWLGLMATPVSDDHMARALVEQGREAT